jgi:hypothetical protein
MADDFEYKLQSKRNTKQHDELMGVIRELVKNLQQTSEADSKISAAIDKNSSAVNGFLNKLNELKPTALPTPNVTVHSDNKEIINALKEFCAELKTGFGEIKNAIQLAKVEQQNEWEFSVKRNRYTDFIETITAKSKSK